MPKTQAEAVTSPARTEQPHSLATESVPGTFVPGRQATGASAVSTPIARAADSAEIRPQNGARTTARPSRS